MKKQKPKSPVEQLFIKFIKIVGETIKRKIDKMMIEYKIQKKFKKEVEYNIKKNREYAKVQNVKRHSLTKGGDIY